MKGKAKRPAAGETRALDGWNPLALDPKSEHFFADASAIAEVLIDGDDHWSASVRDLLSAAIQNRKLAPWLGALHGANHGRKKHEGRSIEARPQCGRRP